MFAKKKSVEPISLIYKKVLTKPETNKRYNTPHLNRCDSLRQNKPAGVDLNKKRVLPIALFR